MDQHIIDERAFWLERRVFVTGATGFLGSWLIEALVNNGADVVGLIRDEVGRSKLFLNGTVHRIITVRGDVADYYTLERVLNEYEIDTVFHIAAQTIVGTANRNPLSTFESNIRGTWNILEACRRSPLVKRVIVASSDKAYGESDKLPYTEEHVLQGSFPYDVSKACADLLSRAYWKTYKLPVCVTRCANLYGGGDLNFNRLIPGTIRTVLLGEAPVIRSSGAPRRDYLYVEDAVRGYLMLAEQMEKKNLFGEAFNFSSGCVMSAAEVVATILKEMGREDLKPVVLNQASLEIKDQWLSSEKARRVLGWMPKNDFATGLAKTISYYKALFGRDV